MYNHKEIEPKWQERWEKERAFEVTEDPKRKDKKKYILDMFPYPSSNGLHVGHPEGYTATDIYSRYLRMNGYHVLHPMGWDAFGLPAENYAIKERVHPAETTQKNIATFKRQIQSLGLSYDWSREIDTSSPEYYRWTQWLFLELYKHNLAVKKKAPVNWCDHCHTVLAHEQVVSNTCERCGNPVVQKELEQWFFKVTTYAEELLSALETLDWPEPIKAAQRNWIGKSEGANIRFTIYHRLRRDPANGGDDSRFTIEVFTTRPDTIFGATYMVLAPEHELVDQLNTRITNWDDVHRYRSRTARKSEFERTHLDKEKTGVPLEGVRAINPANGEEIPVWIADYVLASYGTGAIMAVPAHDQRDFEFAKRFNLLIRMVVCSHYPAPTCPVLEKAYEGDGHVVDSGEFNGLPAEEAKWLIAKKVKGERVTQFRVRDWLISRQRYWGAPIPIIYCASCGTIPVPSADLPVLLPTDVDFKPTGESPLVRSKSFHAVTCPSCGKKARRESDTMDTFVCSSWYYLRYTSPHNTDLPFEQDAINYWMGCPPAAPKSRRSRAEVAPKQSEGGRRRTKADEGGVDRYVGGAEHAVLHLLYARFVTKALRDMGYLSFDEPFLSLRNQGMILGEDGEKMSKSRGNVINPDSVIESFGADTLRIYEMFMGPFENAKPWSTSSIAGVRRFLERVWKLYARLEVGGKRLVDAPNLKPRTSNPEPSLQKLLHKTIKKVTHDIETFNFNTAISSLMILLNAMHDQEKTAVPVDANTRETFLLLLAPFAPHLTEELWEQSGHTGLICAQSWPAFNEEVARDAIVNVIIQINGKVRDTMESPAGTGDDMLREDALKREKIQKWLAGKKPRAIIVARGTVVNIVV